MTTDKYYIPQQLGAQATRRFHVMIKPAGSACNLDCTYCFYLSKDRLPQGPGPGRMDVDEVVIRSYRPKDPLELMAISLASRLFNVAQEGLAFGRALSTIDPNDPTLSHALRAVRTFTELMSALDKHRGKGQQTVRVEHVNVAPGAQAIVGTVTAGGCNGGRDGTKKPG